MLAVVPGNTAALRRYSGARGQVGARTLLEDTDPSTMKGRPMATPRKVRIGEMLLGAGLISEQQLSQALEEQKRSGRRLGRVLIESGLIEETRLARLLAEQLGIEGPSLARSIDQLVQGGFVDRREDPDDRRAKTLHLAPSGAQACEHIEAALAEMRELLYHGIPDEDLLACLRVFGVLRERLGCPAPDHPRARPKPTKKARVP